MVCRLATRARYKAGFDSLEGAAYAEAEDALFLVKDKWKPINDLILPGVWIIRINEAKRHVQNWDLEADFGTEAAADVAKFGE